MFSVFAEGSGTGNGDAMGSSVCVLRCLCVIPWHLRRHGFSFVTQSMANIEPEPAPEDPVDWAMEEASHDEDDAPMPDAPPEPEMIDLPPAPASAPPMSSLERCIALRLVYGAGPR